MAVEPLRMTLVLLCAKKIKQNKIKIKLIVDPDLYLTERRVREKTLGRA